jgi:hypothetical protein
MQSWGWIHSPKAATINVSLSRFPLASVHQTAKVPLDDPALDFSLFCDCRQEVAGVLSFRVRCFRSKMQDDVVMK